MIYIYRALYSFIKNLVILLKPNLPEGLQNWIDLRDKPWEAAKAYKDSYWFHASSGEIEYCKSVIRHLKEANPSAQVIVTYSSPSAEKLFNNISGYVDQFIPLGWDQPNDLKKLFDALQPKYLLFSRTDLWPELIYQANKRNVHLGLIAFNPKFSDLSKLSYRWFLKDFHFISCVDSSTAGQLRSLLSKTAISSDGDTRFDQVFFRLANTSKIELKTEQQVVILGSTWPQDEDVILKNLHWLKEKNIKVVLSPHDVSVENIERLKVLVAELGFSYNLLSEYLRTGNYSVKLDTDVLLIDKIGYLADCYRYADLAFVGGSFKDKVHSVMEPLCCGLNVIVGPLYKNNPEAVRYHDRFVFSVKNETDFKEVFERRIGKDRASILHEMNRNQNASQKVLNLILSTPVKN